MPPSTSNVFYFVYLISYSLTDDLIVRASVKFNISFFVELPIAKGTME